MASGADFGTTGRKTAFSRTMQRTAMLGAALIVGMAGLLIVIKHSGDVAEDRAQTALWTVSGPPCPSITPAYWTQLAIETPATFTFQGLQGQRAHGDVSCSVLDEVDGKPVTAFPVCQFSAPFAVRVTTARGDVDFETIPGRPMTISLPPGGAPRCVLGANLTDW